MAKNYISNEEFEETIFGYKENKSLYEDRLIELLDLLIQNIYGGFGFSLDYEDVRQDCFLLVLRKIENFESDKGSAFNYFTTVILNNIRFIYTKDKRYAEKLEEYTLRFSNNNLVEDLDDV